MSTEYILGIWDGHDSGAALIRGNQILAAVNEERLTRRKLEIKFPEHSVRACLEQSAIAPESVGAVAVSTLDFSKTLTRVFPSLKEEYYLLRRRKKTPGFLAGLKKRAKYRLTEIGHSSATRYFSAKKVSSELRGLGIVRAKLVFLDHHLSHAASAFCCGFEPCLVVTVDGIGDALSGSISVLRDGALERIATIPGDHSLGIFFEHVTNLMNMRELEDEGKVMALANYAYPVPDEQNPMIDMFSIDGLGLRCKYSSLRMYNELKKILWQYPSEQFASMAQRTLEQKLCELVESSLKETGLKNLVLSGGVFSNIKANMKIRKLADVERCFVFPHMGDGGLALGAALALNHERNRVASYEIKEIYWGPQYSEKDIQSAVDTAGLHVERLENVEEKAAELIAGGNIVFWFQGRMEYGPRALGHRSILALPGSQKIKDLINLRLKMRVWYQPFCPSMLEEEAEQYLEEYDGLFNRFMTMGYMVKEDKQIDITGVMNIDGSCRPHIVTAQDGRYERLLMALKRLTGRGIVLNTSFNIHGDPLVCSPRDAVDTMIRTGNEYMVMGDFLIRNTK